MSSKFHKLVASPISKKRPPSSFRIGDQLWKNGFEALRRLTRGYDPATASRKRTMLKTVISPEKQKLESLPQAIEEPTRRDEIQQEIG